MRECDLVMKGGITSGVVYPHAIGKISESYRLRSVGGTSAGAIAAAFAAAAEYRRQTSLDNGSTDGFASIQDLSTELASSMRQLFQPSSNLRDLYELLLAVVTAKPGTKWEAGVEALVDSHILKVVLFSAATILTLCAAIDSSNIWLGVVGLLFWPLVALAWIGRVLYLDVFQRLPANDFGLCPGLRQAGDHEGLTDWICRNIQMIAGRPDADPTAVLTIGDLKTGAGVELAAMTTDLSSRRPFQLPLMTKKFWFSEAEFRRLLPSHVVEYLKGDARPYSVGNADAPADLYPLPAGDAFPVCLLARMSLSFPGLISAVPLWRHDDGLKAEQPSGKLKRCLFSDGGISSNFPIHFYDELIPSRPTLGISLTEWDRQRHGDQRVILPEMWRQADDLPVKTIDTMLGFLGAIVDTAKDWQDTLQSLLPGYAERIAEIRLDPASEGGLNLSMDTQTIERLTDFGRLAGEKFVDFNFDEHRWRRSLCVLPSLEAAFEGMEKAWASVASGPNWSSLEAVLSTYEPKSYADQYVSWRKSVLTPFASALAVSGRASATANATTRPRGKTVQSGKSLPASDARIRYVADADRRPK